MIEKICQLCNLSFLDELVINTQYIPVDVLVKFLFGIKVIKIMTV